MARAILDEAMTAAPDKALMLLEGAWRGFETADAFEKQKVKTLRDKIFGQLELHYKKQNNDRLLQLYRQRLTFKDTLLNVPLRVQYLCRIADVFLLKGQLEQATEGYEVALAAYHLPVHHQMRFRVTYNIARFLRGQQEMQTAKTFFERALEQANDLGDPYMQFQALDYLASLARDAKDSDLAIEHHLESLMLVSQTSQQDKYASTLYNLAGVYFDRKEYDKALDYDQQALEIFTTLDDQEGIAMTQGGIAEIHELHTLNYDAALEFNLLSLQKSLVLKDWFMPHIEAARWLSTARVLLKSPSHLLHPSIPIFQALLGGSPERFPQQCLERAFEIADELPARNLLDEIQEVRELFDL